MVKYCWQTYNLDGQVGESSACATALMCGVKANLETVGLDAGGKFDNCFSSLASKVDSLIDWAHKAGEYNHISNKIYLVEHLSLRL